MSKLLKIGLLGALVFFTLGIGLLIAAVALGATWSAFTESVDVGEFTPITTLHSKTEQTLYYPEDDVYSLDIEFGKGTLELRETDEDQIMVEILSDPSHAVTSEMIGKTLKISTKNNALREDTNLRIYIPEDNSAAQVAELQARIDELEAQNAMAHQSQQPNEMELMEQSYKLAAQYLGTGNGGQKAVIVDEPEEDRKVMPVNQVNRNVVSSLSASTDNTRSFSTAVGTKLTNFKNTISACVATDQSVTDGQSVRLRTLEPMWIGNSLLPKNTSIVGVARLQGERLEIKIENIEALGCIMEVDLSVYDSDGQEGINIPNSMESDALHEIGANMGSTMGSSINLTTNAGAQLASDMGKGLINGVSQYLNKKLRTVKVHLKSGYKIMLKQNEQ